MDKENKVHTPKGRVGMNMAGGEKAKDFKKAIKRLFKELGGYKALIMIAIILAFLSSVLSILSPNKLSDLTNEISKGLVINQDNFEKLTKAISENLNKKLANMNMGSNESNTQNGINMSEFPKEMLESIFEEIEIDGEKISPEEQYEFISIMGNMSKDIEINELYKNIEKMPQNIQKVIKPKMNIDTIKNIALFLVVLYVCSSLFSYIQSICMTNVSNRFAKKLRSRISIKINKLPLKYFDKHQTGDILSRVTNDVDTIAQTMNQSLGTLVSSVALFIGTIIMMFYTNWIMAITAIMASLIGFVGMILILKNSQKYFKAKQEELGNLNAHIEEIYSGLNVVKVYNGREDAIKKFNEYNKKVCEANKKSQFLSGLMQPLMSFIGNFGYVAVCIVGAILAQKEIITFEGERFLK